MLINPELTAKCPAGRTALLQLGFRPFFLLAGLSACLPLLYWSHVYASGVETLAYPPATWHGHEMVFGYVVAVVAGFLLTVVKNWTGRQTLNGIALMSLALLWIAGRIVPVVDADIPLWCVSLVDFAFVPLLAVALAVPIVKAGNHRNLIFIVILAVYTAANGIFHLGVNGLLADGARLGIFAGLFTVLLLISVMGGRVIPFFIQRGLGGRVTARKWKGIEVLSTISLLALAGFYLPGADARVTAVTALVTAAVHAIRLAGWYQNGVWNVPLLWVLVTAYGWLVIGLLMMGLALAGFMAEMLAIHAITAGGIGLITAGMMVRVSMGHSGRSLHAPDSLVLAFMLLNIAAITRVFVPLAWPALYQDTVIVSAWLWAIAFAIFVIRMAPVYWQPRVDGRPG